MNPTNIYITSIGLCPLSRIKRIICDNHRHGLIEISNKSMVITIVDLFQSTLMITLQIVDSKYSPET